MSINTYVRNGKKFYEVRVKGRDSNGKQICRRKAGFASYQKAKVAELELYMEVSKLAGEETPKTFQDWHEECLKQMRLEYKESTMMGYDGGLKKYLSHDWNKRFLKDFVKLHVHELIYDEMSAVSAQTKKTVFKRIHRLFEMAVEEGILAKNPASGIKIKLPPTDQRVLNSLEAETLLREALDCNHRFYPVWTFALQTGMRSGEMYSIRWSDIDFEANLISIKRQWTSKDGLHPTKSNRNRVVPLGADLKNYLIEWKLQSGGGFTEKLWDGILKREVVLDDLVLPRLREWRSGEQADILRDFCRHIGITEVKFHDLRATFITNLLAQGVPLVKVMSIVGHSKMATTDRYLRLAGVGLEESTEKLGYRIPQKSEGQVISLTQRQKS